MAINKRLINTKQQGSSSTAKWVASTSLGLAYTTDASALTGWTDVAISPFGGRGEGPPLWNGTAWVAVGRSGSNDIAYSSDGVTWSTTGVADGGGSNVGWNGDYWLVTTSNSAYYTSDVNGATGWTEVSNGLNGETAASSNNIIWDGTNWVVAGTDLWYIIGSSPNGSKSTILNPAVWAQVAWQGPLGNFIIGLRDSSMLGYYMTDGDGTGLTSSSGSFSSVQSGCIATSTGAALSSTSNNYWYSSDGSSYTTGSTFTSSGVSANYNGTITVVTSPATASIFIITGENINQNIPSLSTTSTGISGTFRSIASDNDYYRFI